MQSPDNNKSSTKELLILSEVAKTLALPLNLPELLQKVMDRIGERIGPAEFGYISLFNPTDGLLHPCAFYGQGIQDENALLELNILEGEGISGSIYNQDNAILYDSPAEIIEAFTNLMPKNRKLLNKAFGENDVIFNSIIGFPIKVGEKKFGALLIGTLLDLKPFNQNDVNFFQTFTDIIALAIDRAKLENEAYSYREFEHADRVRAEALAILSHELRTPLATIKGYASALLLDGVSWSLEKQKKFLQFIEEESDTLQIMITDILDSSLIDAGQLNLEYQPVRIERLVKLVVDEFQHRFENYKFVIDFPTDFPIIDGDSRRLKQVLRNIIDNSIRYSKNEGLIVIQGIVREMDVVISIADQGVGISPEDLIPLFDKYFRVKSPIGYYVPGTGLGLPVARAIIETHKGRIWAESKVGEGTKISFSLPLVQDIERA